MDTKTLIKKARASLVIESPFFGSLILRLDMKEAHGIGTAATDGAHIFYDPQFIQKLSHQQIKGVLAHEVMHCALAHTTRKGERDHGLWSVAGDLVINDILFAEGFELPEGVLNDKQFSGMTTESVYEKIRDDKQYTQKAAGHGKGKNWDIGQVLETPGDKAQVESEWKVALQQAAQAAKAQGKLPAAIKRLVQEILYPKLPWREILRQFVEHNARNDYSWQRINRRYQHLGVLLPGIQSDNLENLAVAIDTSGSISEKDLADFAGELSGILAQYDTECRVIYCDATVHKVDVFRSGDPIQLNPQGGGGTDFRPVFEYCDQNPPKCLVFMTDLMGSFPESAPGYPVLWVTNRDTNSETGVPFGAVCTIK